MNFFVFAIVYLITAQMVFAISGNKTEDRIVDSVAELIRGKPNVDSVYVRMYSPQSRFASVDADNILSIEPLDTFNIRYQRFRVSHLRNSKKAFLVVTLELRVFAPVAVPVENIVRGEENFSHKIAYKVVDITEFRNIVTKKDDFIGMRALANLQANVPVSQNSLRKIPHVSKGANITVVYKRDSILLSFETEALRDGYIGDKIHFRNPFNRQIRFGTVIAENKVTIR